MKKNLLFIGIAVLLVAVVLYFALTYEKKEDPTSTKTTPKEAPDITSEILRGVENYIKGNEDIVDLLKNSEKHRTKLIEILQNEPAFTLGLSKIMSEQSEYDAFVLDFASHFETPEIYTELINYARIRGLDKDKYFLVSRIIASGKEKALDAIFNRYYDPKTGRISDVRDFDTFIQFFPHYYQLKFWLTKYEGKKGNQNLNSAAKNAYNNALVYYSPESMKTQLRLLDENDNIIQDELILWGLAPNRIRPEWYSWFVPMLCEAISKKNTLETSLFHRPLVEIFELARRDSLIDALEAWLKNNPKDTIGFKHLQIAVMQGRTSIERYRANNSLRTNEITGDEEGPDPDEIIPSLFDLQPSSVNLEIYKKLAAIYAQKGLELFGSYRNADNILYNFESFSMLRQYYFDKPYLFEIARKANIQPAGETWRSKFFDEFFSTHNISFENEDLTSEEMSATFINLQGYLWGEKKADTAVKAELFKLIDKLLDEDAQIAKFLHLGIVEFLAMPATVEEVKDFIDAISGEELADEQKFSLVQILASNLDSIYKDANNLDFNPFQICIDKGLIDDYSNVLNALILRKHKYSEILLRNLLKMYPDDETLVISVLKKINYSKFDVMQKDVAQFLDSENPVIIAEAVKILPFDDEYLPDFERLMTHVDPIIKCAAASRMLASKDDSKVVNAISILREEQSELLWGNLWRIKKVSIVQPLLLEIAQTKISDFAFNIKMRSDLLLDESVYNETLRIYTTTDDTEVQADVLKSLLTREDKVPDLLITAAKNKDNAIRKIAWDFAVNNPKMITTDLILILLDSEYYKDVQRVLNYLSKNTSWMIDYKDIKTRVLEFLKETKEGLEFSAVFALMNIPEDTEVATAFCRAINDRVLWPVSVQVWLYIENFKNMTVAETMIDIIAHEEQNSTDFASSYLNKVVDDIKGLREKIYKAFDETENEKSVVEFLPVFTGTMDKNAVKLLVNKDYKKLSSGKFKDDVHLPREVAKALSIILELEPDARMQEKAYWQKYLKD